MPVLRASASALLAALLLAAACGSAGERDVVSGSSSTSSPSSTVVAGTVPAPTAEPGATIAPAPPAVPSTSRREGPAAGGAPPPTTPAAVAAIDAASRDVGQLAPFLLRPGDGDRIVVEVRAQQGAEPTGPVIDHVVRILAAASGKQVLVDGPDLVPGEGQDWDEGSLAALADRRAELRQGGDQVVLRLLFLHGTFRGERSDLGAAVRRDVAAVFTDRIAASAGLTDPEVVLDSITVHEVGHLLGLVDLVLGGGRGDPEHPGHSRNRGSVMYWAVEGDAIAQLLGARIPTELDADDRAELAAIRRG